MSSITFCVVIFVALFFTGCDKEHKPFFQGYIEGDFVHIASPLAGQLTELHVDRGMHVKSGDLLFVLEQEKEKAELVTAEQEVKRAMSHLDDLRKGQRPSELKTIEARLEKAQSILELSKKEFARRKNLLGSNAIATEDVDRAATALEQDKAVLEELQAQLETANLGARIDIISAAQAELDAAKAKRKQAVWALNQKSQHVTQDGLIYDTLFDCGEFVSAGTPVISLLPPNNIKVRFFVPEPLLGTLHIGEHIRIDYDGSKRSLPGTVTFISPKAEYTPPVIYSQETRAKLVFMVEALPDPDRTFPLHPGQPVDVYLGD